MRQNLGKIFAEFRAIVGPRLLDREPRAEIKRECVRIEKKAVERSEIRPTIFVRLITPFALGRISLAWPAPRRLSGELCDIADRSWNR